VPPDRTKRNSVNCRAAAIVVPQHKMQKLTIVFEPCQEGGFHGYVKEIPGVHSQGETVRETAENVLDALKELLAYRAGRKLASRPDSLEVDLALVE